LWAARNIRYFPLAVHDACLRHGIPLTLRLPNEAAEVRTPIDTLEPRACLGIRPNQALYLYGRFADAVRHHFHLDRAEAARKARELLTASEFSNARHGARACYGQ